MFIRLAFAVLLLASFAGGDAITCSAHPCLILPEDRGGQTVLQILQTRAAIPTAQYTALATAADTYICDDGVYPAQDCTISNGNASLNLRVMALYYKISGTAKYGTRARFMMNQIATTTSTPYNLWVTSSTKTVTNATNADPIVITTSAAHGYSTGNYVRIADVTGNTAANGDYSITVLTTTTFSIPAIGNGAYAGGGTSLKAFVAGGGDSNYWRSGEASGFMLAFDWLYADLTAGQKSNAIAYITGWMNYFGYQTASIGCCEAGGNFIMGKVANNLRAAVVLFADVGAPAQAVFDLWRDYLVANQIPFVATGLASGGISAEGSEYWPQSAGSFLASLLTIQQGSGEDLYASVPTFLEELTKSLAAFVTPTAGGERGVYETITFGDEQYSPSRQWYISPSWRGLALVVFDRQVAASDTTNAAYTAYWLANIMPTWNQGLSAEPTYVRDSDMLYWNPSATQTNYAGTLLSATGDYMAGAVGSATQGSRYVFSRSDWTADATFLFLSGSPGWTGNHKHTEAGSFYIYRKGVWLLTAMPGYTNDDSRYFLSSFNNSLFLNGHGQACTNFGGCLSNTVNGGKALAQVTRYGTGTGYMVAQVDQADSYNVPSCSGSTCQVTTALRDFLYLRPDLLVIGDRVVHNTSSTSWGRGTRANFNALGTLSWSAPRITVANGTERAYIDVVYPESPVVSPQMDNTQGQIVRLETAGSPTRLRAEIGSITGTKTIAGYTGGCAVLNGSWAATWSSSSYNTFTIPYDSTSLTGCDDKDGQWGYYTTFLANAWGNRMVVMDPALPTTTSYLFVVQSATDGDAILAKTRLTSTNVNSVQIGDGYVVSTLPTSSYPASFSYTFTGGGLVHHYVVGLKASTAYTISYPTANDVSVVEGAGTTTTAQGVLAFDTSAGPGTLDHFAVSCPTTPIVAGVSQNCTITAQDSSNATVTSYTGSPICTSTDPQAVIGSCASFVSGVKTVSLVLKTAGVSGYYLCATDGVPTGCSTAITVNAAAAASCTLTGIATPRTAGIVSHDAVAAFVDAYNNEAIPTGNNSWTSTDGAATLPATATCPATSCTYDVTLNTAGSQNVTVTNAGGSFNCSQNGIVVNAAAVNLFPGKGL